MPRDDQPTPSRPPARSPSLEMLFLGFALGVVVAILLGAPTVAPALGVVIALLFAATDL